MTGIDDLDTEGHGDGGFHGNGGVIAIGRRKYAVGLSWQISPSGRISQAAREAARDSRVPMDFFSPRTATKTGRIGQFGLSLKSFGHKPGMPSGAVSLAADQPGAWAGAFKLPEGIWVCVCRDDLITPDGDVLFKDEMRARERMVAEINLGGLQQIYAPEEWNLPGSDSIPLSLLIKNRAEGYLRPVKINVAQIAGIVAVVLVAASVAWYMFSSQQEGSQHIQLPREQAAIQQMKNQNVIPESKLLPSTNVPTAPRQSWEDEPKAQTFFRNCQNGLAGIPATAAGWKRGDVICNSSSIIVAWTRGVGAAEIPPNAGQLHAYDSSANSSYPLPPVERRGIEQLADPIDIDTLFINNDWHATLAKLPDDPLPPQPDGTPTPPPPWIKEKLTISSDNPPWMLDNQIQTLPGLVIQSVRWVGHTWTTEGLIYENRK